MILGGDVRTVLPTLDAVSVQCVITSPPYWGLRDYGIDNQIGLEPTPDAYVQTLVAVFQEVRRVLRDDGTVWLNLGDCYATGAGKVGSEPGGGRQGERWKDRAMMTPPNRMPIDGLKAKDLVMVPFRLALALQADGWWVRSDIIWAKGVSFCPAYSGSVMPESVTDRPTTSHEHVFLLTKSARYFYDADAVREDWADDRKGAANGRNWARRETRTASTRRPQDAPRTSGRNLRSVWTIPPQPYSEAHFATFPTALVEPCIKAGTKTGDLVLDPFAGSGTVGCVALKLGREFLGIELNPAYCTMARESIMGPLFAGPSSKVT